MMVSISILTPSITLGAMARGQSFTSTGKLINHTRVNDPNKPVSIYVDVCPAIAKNTGPGQLWGG
jgi:hypothetical protein